MTRFLLLVFSATCLASCDPGYSIVLRNTSANNRVIKVIEPAKPALDHIDSVPIKDASTHPGLRYSEKVIAIKDTAQRSYSFMLGAGKTAILESGIIPVYFPEQIIIDNLDTIRPPKDKRIVITRKLMNTFVVITTE